MKFRTFKIVAAILISHVLIPTASAQSQAESLSCLEKVFFHKKVLSKVFFEYSAGLATRGAAPSGLCAFIFPDTIFTRHFPDIFNRFDWSWPREQMVETTSLIKKENATLYSSINLMNVDIEFWIRFDKWAVTNDRLEIIFHTTDYSGKSPTSAFNYFQVTSTFKKSISGWKLVDIEVVKIDCCDDREDFRKSAKRPE